MFLYHQGTTLPGFSFPRFPTFQGINSLWFILILSYFPNVPMFPGFLYHRLYVSHVPIVLYFGLGLYSPEFHSIQNHIFPKFLLSHDSYTTYIPIVLLTKGSDILRVFILSCIHWVFLNSKGFYTDASSYFLSVPVLLRPVKSQGPICPGFWYSQAFSIPRPTIFLYFHGFIFPGYNTKRVLH